MGRGVAAGVKVASVLPGKEEPGSAEDPGCRAGAGLGGAEEVGAPKGLGHWEQGQGR